MPVSDWSILNDTRSKQLRRILAKFYHLTESKIHFACVLLESYHAVYRRDRLEQRRNQLTSEPARIQRPCLPPTDTQLHEIALQVNAKTASSIRTEEVMAQLKDLAQRLQEYHLYVRGAFKEPDSWNERRNSVKIDGIHTDNSQNNGYLPFLPMHAL